MLAARVEPKNGPYLNNVQGDRRSLPHPRRVVMFGIYPGRHSQELRGSTNGGDFWYFEGIVNIIAAALAFLWPAVTVVSFVFLMCTWAILSGGLMLSAAMRLSGITAVGGLCSVVLHQ